MGSRRQPGRRQAKDALANRMLFLKSGCDPGNDFFLKRDARCAMDDFAESDRAAKPSDLLVCPWLAGFPKGHGAVLGHECEAAGRVHGKQLCQR